MASNAIKPDVTGTDIGGYNVSNFGGNTGNSSSVNIYSDEETEPDYSDPAKDMINDDLNNGKSNYNNWSESTEEKGEDLEESGDSYEVMYGNVTGYNADGSPIDPAKDIINDDLNNGKSNYNNWSESTEEKREDLEERKQAWLKSIGKVDGYNADGSPIDPVKAMINDDLNNGKSNYNNWSESTEEKREDLEERKQAWLKSIGKVDGYNADGSPIDPVKAMINDDLNNGKSNYNNRSDSTEEKRGVLEDSGTSDEEFSHEEHMAMLGNSNIGQVKKWKSATDFLASNGVKTVKVEQKGTGNTETTNTTTKTETGKTLSDMLETKGIDEQIKEKVDATINEKEMSIIEVYDQNISSIEREIYKLHENMEQVNAHLYDLDLLELSDFFPKCLYDESYAEKLDENSSYNMVSELLEFYGIENSDVSYEVFLNKVKTGEYKDSLLEIAGSTNVTDNFVNLYNYLCEYKNRDDLKVNIDPFDIIDNIESLDSNEQKKMKYYREYKFYWDLRSDYEHLIDNSVFVIPGKYNEEKKIFRYASFCITTEDEKKAFIENLSKSLTNGTFREFEDLMEQKARNALFEREIGDFKEFKGSVNLSDDMYGLTSKYIGVNNNLYSSEFKNLVLKFFNGRSGEAFPLSVYPSDGPEVKVPALDDVSIVAFTNFKLIASTRNRYLKEQEESLESSKNEFERLKKIHILYNAIDISDYEQYTKDFNISIKDKLLSFSDLMSNVKIDDYLSVMSEEEKKNFIYFYNKYKDEGYAKEYFLLLRDDLTRDIGFKRAVEFVSHLISFDDEGNYYYDAEKIKGYKVDLEALSNIMDGFLVSYEGFSDGIDTFREGLMNAFFSDGKASADDYEKSFKCILLSYSGYLGHAYNISSSLGNIAIPMVVSAIVTAISKGTLASTTKDFIITLIKGSKLGTLVGSSLSAFSTFGNSMESGKQNGMSSWQAILYGSLSGLSEATLGYFLGAIPGLSKIDDIPGVKGFLLNMFKEGMEESAQSILSPLFMSMLTGEKPDINWTEVKTSGIYGMITAGLLNGGMIYINGEYCNVQSLKSEAVEKIANAESMGLQVEYTVENLTDPIKAEEAVSNAMKSSTFDRIKNKLYLNNQVKIPDSVVFDLFKNSISNARSIALTNGDMDIVNMLDKLYLLKNLRPDFGVYYDENAGAYSQAYTDGSIVLGYIVINGNQIGVVYHELGHTLHGAINNSAVPSNYMDVKRKVYEHMSNNTAVVEYYTNYIQQCANSAATSAANYFDTYMSASVIEQLNQINWDEVRDNYRQMGFSEENIEMMVTNDYNAQYNNIRDNEIKKLADIYQRQWGIDAFSDIIGSVYNGTKRFAILDSNGNKIYLGGDLSYNHDIDYYQFNVDVNGNVIDSKTLVQTNEAAFHEQIANYVQLKLSGNQQMLDALSNLLGNEWIQMMETEFNKITDYFK